MIHMVYLLKIIVGLEASHHPIVVYSGKKLKVAGVNKKLKIFVAPQDDEDNLSLMQIKHKKKKTPPLHAEEKACVNAIIDKVVSTMLGGVLQVENDSPTNDDRNTFHRAQVYVECMYLCIPLLSFDYQLSIMMLLKKGQLHAIFSHIPPSITQYAATYR